MDIGVESMNIALFVDCNSIKKEYIDAITREARKQGNVILKKAYGNIDDEELRDTLERNLYYIEETGTEYADRIPAELIADFMFYLMEDDHKNRRRADQVIVATGDEYIRPVLNAHLANGARVTIYGTKSASKQFVYSTGSFRYVEMLAGEDVSEYVTPKADVVKNMLEMITMEKGSARLIDARGLCEALLRMYPEFDVRNYGYTKFTTFVTENISNINIEETASGIAIRQIDDGQEIQKYIYEFLGKRDNKVEDMSELFAAIKLMYPYFDIKNYGYTNEIAYILSIPKLEIYENKGVKLKQTFKIKA